jgi:phosphopantothenoylcysteine decarboxylase/phosphopantothenate--cysteine ligase
VWENKRVLLGVTGSIAAYKAADICSKLGKQGADVHVVLTRNAAEFVGPATFRALTRNPVLTDTFEEPHSKRIAHIDIAQSVDLAVVAPASANLIAKAAAGIADDMLTTCLLALPRTTPLLIAPAMNTVMWEHPATQRNLAILRERGTQIVDPASGILACLDEGQGKLADVETIVAAMEASLQRQQDLTGLRILVTAGATREPIDPVRFLSNRSSGKMGYAVAADAASRGAEVTLLSGYASVTAPPGVNVVHASSADEMAATALDLFSSVDVAIGAAAVADYTPREFASQKIKKKDGRPEDDVLTIVLRRTQDVIASLGARKQLHQLVVGFAAETEDLIANAKRKLVTKHLDLVVANDVSATDAGFETDTNRISLLWPDGRQQDLPLMSKREAAGHILDAVKAMVAILHESITGSVG